MWLGEDLKKLILEVLTNVSYNLNMEYKLTKIKSNHNNVRDDVINCRTCTDIVIGQTVVLTAESRDFKGGIRLIETTPVVAFDKLNETTVEIKTKSGSVYRIEATTN
jgi:hypothetical protein